MSILITGAKGFLGTNLSTALTGVLTWDLQDGKDIFDPRIEDSIISVDRVIHLAALTSVAESFKNPHETFRVNVLGTARIIELCIKHNKKLLYPSSASVFEPKLSPYAHSKYLAEEIVKGAMGMIDVTILRFVNMFGPHMNSRSGSMMYNFLNNDKITIYGDGEQTRDFIHVRDVIEIVKSSFGPEWSNKIVDVGTGEAYSTNYVASLFSYYRKIPVSHEIPKREMRWHATDTTVLKSLYKKPLTTNLEKDIQELCQAHSTL